MLSIASACYTASEMPLNFKLARRKLRSAPGSQLRFILFAPLMFLSGCASNEPLYGHIYEGLRMRETIVHPLEPKPPEKSMSYQEYQVERKKLLEGNDKK